MEKPLNELIKERLAAKDLNLEKALQLTEIPRHYLEAILKGQWSRLPAAPYAKGYLKKIAAIIDSDGKELWDLYENESEVRASGANDKLPENRFAIKTANHRLIWPIAIVAALAVYVFLNADRFLGVPKIDVDSPLSATFITTFPSFTLRGNADPRDKLYINGEEVYIDKNGGFQKNYNLQPGVNTFEFLATRFLGRENKVVKQIIYQPNNL